MHHFNLRTDRWFKNWIDAEVKPMNGGWRPKTRSRVDLNRYRPNYAHLRDIDDYEPRTEPLLMPPGDFDRAAYCGDRAGRRPDDPIAQADLKNTQVGFGAMPIDVQVDLIKRHKVKRLVVLGAMESATAECLKYGTTQVAVYTPWELPSMVGRRLKATKSADHSRRIKTRWKADGVFLSISLQSESLFPGFAQQMLCRAREILKKGGVLAFYVAAGAESAMPLMTEPPIDVLHVEAGNAGGRVYVFKGGLNRSRKRCDRIFEHDLREAVRTSLYRWLQGCLHNEKSRRRLDLLLRKLRCSKSKELRAIRVMLKRHADLSATAGEVHELLVAAVMPFMKKMNNALLDSQYLPAKPKARYLAKVTEASYLESCPEEEADLYHLLPDCEKPYRREVFEYEPFDRIFLGAINVALTRLMEATLGRVCHGGRPGRSHKQAVSAIQAALDSLPNPRHAVIDIRDCFGSIDLDGLQQLLLGQLPDLAPDVQGLMTSLKREGKLRQGNPVTPLLANIALDRWLDRGFAAFPVFALRWIDDIVIIGRSLDVNEALRSLRKRLSAKSLEVSPKTLGLVLSGPLTYLGLELSNARVSIAHDRLDRILADLNQIMSEGVLCDVLGFYQQVLDHDSMQDLLGKIGEALRESGWMYWEDTFGLWHGGERFRSDDKVGDDSPAWAWGQQRDLYYLCTTLPAPLLKTQSPETPLAGGNGRGATSPTAGGHSTICSFSPELDAAVPLEPGAICAIAADTFQIQAHLAHALLQPDARRCRDCGVGSCQEDGHRPPITAMLLGGKRVNYLESATRENSACPAQCSTSFQSSLNHPEYFSRPEEDLAEEPLSEDFAFVPDGAGPGDFADGAINAQIYCPDVTKPAHKQPVIKSLLEGIRDCRLDRVILDLTCPLDGDQEPYAQIRDLTCKIREASNAARSSGGEPAVIILLVPPRSSFGSQSGEIGDRVYLQDFLDCWIYAEGTLRTEVPRQGGISHNIKYNQTEPKWRIFDLKLRVWRGHDRGTIHASQLLSSQDDALQCGLDVGAWDAPGRILRLLGWNAEMPEDLARLSLRARDALLRDRSVHAAVVAWLRREPIPTCPNWLHERLLSVSPPGPTRSGLMSSRKSPRASGGVRTIWAKGMAVAKDVAARFGLEVDPRSGAGRHGGDWRKNMVLGESKSTKKLKFRVALRELEKLLTDARIQSCIPIFHVRFGDESDHYIVGESMPGGRAKEVIRLRSVTLEAGDQSYDFEFVGLPGVRWRSISPEEFREMLRETRPGSEPVD